MRRYHVICERCGHVEMSAYKVRLCAQCAIEIALADQDEPATGPAGPWFIGDCDYCGRPIDYGTLCRRCDPWVRA